jgi:hypothetical protein
MIIQVAILNKVYVSDDQGHSWRQYPRQVKAGPTIRYLGVAAESHVPFELPDVIWDFIYLSPDGHGVAVNHEKTHNATGPEAKGTFVANVFITTNHARKWVKNPLRLNWVGRMRSLFSWPVEQFHSLAVTRNRTVLLAWEDPWIMERSISHLIYTHDSGPKWNYHRLKPCQPPLYTSPEGQVFCFGKEICCISRDEGNHWQSDAMTLDLTEDDPNAVCSDILDAVFISDQQGFGLSAKFNKAVTMTRPESVVLLKTTNNGLRWNTVAEFSFPSTQAFGDPKQILSLAVTLR